MLRIRIITLFLICCWLITACDELTKLNDILQVEPDVEQSIVGIDADLYSEFVEWVNLQDCQLPCWWGIYIGQSTLDEVYTLLEASGFNRSQSRTIYADIPARTYIKSESYSLVFTYRTDEIADIGDVTYYFAFDLQDMVRYINVQMRSPNRWLDPNDNPLLLPKIFADTTIQPDIYVGSPRLTSSARYPITIVFRDLGYEIQYYFDFRHEYPLLCPTSKNTNSINIEIYPDKQELTVSNGTSILTPEESGMMGSLTSKEFVEFFRENSDDCLNITDYPREEN